MSQKRDINGTNKADLENNTTRTITGDCGDLLRPLIASFQQARETMSKELNTDPAPEFTSSQVQETTNWLLGIIQAMHEHNSGFRKTNLSNLSDEALERQQELAREASRQLTLLFADSSSKFNDNAKYQIVEFCNGSQSSEIRLNLRKFTDFINHFGENKWLGELVAPEFLERKENAVRLLKALQNPSRRVLPGCAPCNRGACGPLIKMLETKPTLFDGIGRAGERSSEHLERLARMTGALTEAFLKDAYSRAMADEELNKKMKLLKEFAEAMNKVQEVLLRFLLIRSGSLKSDLKDLKAWCSKAEAENIQQLLDKFRDDATEEKVMRRVEKKCCRASSVASSCELATDD